MPTVSFSFSQNFIKAALIPQSQSFKNSALGSNSTNHALHVAWISKSTSSPKLQNTVSSLRLTLKVCKKDLDKNKHKVKQRGKANEHNWSEMQIRSSTKHSQSSKESWSYKIDPTIKLNNHCVENHRARWSTA